MFVYVLPFGLGKTEELLLLAATATFASHGKFQEVPHFSASNMLFLDRYHTQSLPVPTPFV